jgi:hypothetical protein
MARLVDKGQQKVLFARTAHKKACEIQKTAVPLHRQKLITTATKDNK